jgi:regulatory protein
MRSAPRKQASEEDMYAAALAALGRRAYSIFEMRTYLERRSETPEIAKNVLARMRAERLIDDARYAVDFARARVRFRRQGQFRITRELRQRGLQDKHIEAAIQEAFSETDEGELVRKVIERRMRLARGPMNEKKIASLYGTLLRAGFNSEVARRELRTATRSNSSLEVPEAELPGDSS